MPARTRSRRRREVAGTYGTFSLDEDGSWIYRLDNADPDTDALTAGQTAADSFAVTSADGTAATVAIAVTGANDAAVIGGELTGAATEDAASSAAQGRLTVRDPDAGQDTFAAQSEVAGTYGTFSLGEDGSWIYRLDNADPDTDALAAGQTATDSFSVTSADGTAATVAIAVTGANDAAVIGGELTGAATEDAASSAAQGRLTVRDPDAGQDTFAAQSEVAGTYGTFSLGEDGSWIYRLDNADPDTDALTAGQTATDSFSVTSADGTAATVAIAVTGANDAAVIGGDLTGAATEDAASSAAQGRLTVRDPDAGQDTFAAQSEVAGTYGTFSLDEDGSWIYRLDNADPDTDALTAGQTATDSFAVTSADGTAATVDDRGDRGQRRGGYRRRPDRGGDRGRGGDRRRAGQADRERPGRRGRVRGGDRGGGDLRNLLAGRGRFVDLPARQRGPGHRRADRRADGGRQLRGDQRRRHGGDGDDRGDRGERRGGYRRRPDRGGDRGRGLIGGAGQADRPRPGCRPGHVRGARIWRGPTEPSRWARTVRGSTGSTTRTRTPMR